MIINHNMSSIFAANQSSINSNNVQKSMEKLSSGLKINRAADDASGLAVSEKMRSRIRGLSQAGENIQNGISFVQTAEGYLNETTEILQRIRELSIQGSNGIYSDEDRTMIQVEVSQLVSEVNRIATSAQFNGYNILDGNFSENGLKLHVGSDIDQTIEIKINSVDSESLGLTAQGNSISVSSADEANLTIGIIDEALNKVNKTRADLGAMQNRMELALKGNSIAIENMTASESRIRDTNYAEEMVEFSKNMIISQANTAMLAQANSNSNLVLKLLS